ncbi:hypothetical protein AgCh_035399 [Apium graveolens]
MRIRIGDVKDALRLFERMGRRGNLSGISEDVFVGNAIVDMIAKCELMDEVNKVSKRMKVNDVVSWNAMVIGYSQVGRFEDALSLFEMMKVEKRFDIDENWKRMDFGCF